LGNLIEVSPSKGSVATLQERSDRLVRWSCSRLRFLGLFKWRQFEPGVILLAVGWYLRFSLSYRDVEDLLAERGLLVDHVSVWRWIQRPTTDSWRVDEMYLRVKGMWRYLYRALDSSGATLDFLLWSQAGRGREQSASRAEALGQQNHPAHCSSKSSLKRALFVSLNQKAYVPSMLPK
jgi:hypothetical protein